MNNEIQNFLKKYPVEIQDIFYTLRNIIYSLSLDIKEKMFINLPSYYYGDKFVRIIPFKEYVNIQALGFALNEKDFEGYTFSPKGMIQITPNDTINEEKFKKAFKDSLIY